MKKKKSKYRVVDVLPLGALPVSAAAKKKGCTSHLFYNEWKKKVVDPIKRKEPPKEISFEIIQYAGINFILLTPPMQKTGS